MIFTWIFSVATVLFLSILNIFFELHENSYIYLMTFGILSMFPIFLPVIDFIKKDAEKSEKFLTKVGIIGTFAIFSLLVICFFILNFKISTIIFLFFLLFGIFFAIDARWFFFSGLISLGFVIIALMLGQKVFAENLSIFLYFCLVIGVIVEIVSPFFKKFHKNSREIFTISANFKTEYKKEILMYFYILSIFITIGQIFLLIGQGKFLSFDMNLYIFLSFASTISFFIYAIFNASQDNFLEFFAKIFPFGKQDFFVKYFSKIINFAIILAVIGVFLLFNSVLIWWQLLVAGALMVIFIKIFMLFLPKIYGYARR